MTGRKFLCTKKSFYAVFLMGCLLFCPFRCSGADDKALLKAAELVASGKGSAADEALLFMENRRMNHLAMEGKLSGAAYQKLQKAFDGKNRELAAMAAEDAGFSAAGGEGEKTYRPGTDTDVQLRGKDLTAADVEKARKAYNKRVENYLGKSGLAVDKETNWASRTETDIMPSPAQMKNPKEFAKAASYLNGDGGNMYASPLAAEAQGKLDGGDAVSLAEGQAYAEEMKSKIAKMKKDKAALMEGYRASENPQERDALAAEIRKAESHEAKYIDRINRLEKNIRNSSGLAGGDQATSPLLEAARARGQEKINRRGEAAVDALSGHLTEKAVRNYAETLGDLAASSAGAERRGALKAAAADALKMLPPSRQGEALSQLQNRHGKEFAGEIAAEMKKQPVSKTPTTAGGKVLKGLGTISALVTGYNALMEENRKTSGNPDYGKVALNLAYDLTLRGTAEAVTSRTATYTKEQVDYLREYYRKRGENPDSLAVKMKIAAEASAKGTAYGAVTGSYEFAKATGQWTGGVIVEGAETILSLAGEALETLNVLEETAATLQEQGMAREVQDAKSLASAKELVRELKRFSAMASTQREVLEQNTRWVQTLDIQRSRSLDELRSLIAAAGEAPDPRLAEKGLDKAEKTYAPAFLNVMENSEMVFKKIEEVRKALARGEMPADGPKDMEFLRGEHRGNLESFQKLTVNLEEIGSIADLEGTADILASLGSKKEAVSALADMAEGSIPVMKKNRDGWKTAVSEYDRIKGALARGYLYFYGKREIPGWMVIKSDEEGVAPPVRSLPDGFAAELGALERMKENVLSDLGRLPQARGDEGALRKTAQRARGIYSTLLPSLERTRSSLEKTDRALEQLLAELSKAPPVLLAVSAPSKGVVAQKLTFRVDSGDVPEGAVFLWDFGDGTGGEGREQTHAYGREGTFSGSARMLQSKGGAELSRKAFSVEITAPETDGSTKMLGKISGLAIPPDPSAVLAKMLGFPNIPEGKRERKEKEKNGVYNTEEKYTAEYSLLFLTPDRKDLRISLREGGSLPETGKNTFLGLGGFVNYSESKYFAPYYYDYKNVLREGTGQLRYTATVALSYLIADSKRGSNPASTLRDAKTQLWLEEGTPAAELKARGISILQKGALRISKRAGAYEGCWSYGAVMGDFIATVDFKWLGINSDKWKRPAYDPDEIVWQLLGILFP